VAEQSTRGSPQHPRQPTAPAGGQNARSGGAAPAGTRCRRLADRALRAYRESVVVDISNSAAEFIGGHGGRLWVWAARPRICCASTPAWMHAATEAPAGLSGFRSVTVAGVQVFYRCPGTRLPDTLGIGLRGRRHPRVEAYWDGCLMAMG
jgi:hypothetical protein